MMYSGCGRCLFPLGIARVEHDRTLRSEAIMAPPVQPAPSSVPACLRFNVQEFRQICDLKNFMNLGRDIAESEFPARWRNALRATRGRLCARAKSEEFCAPSFPSFLPVHETEKS